MVKEYDEDLSFLSEMNRNLERRWEIRKKTLKQYGSYPEPDLMKSFTASLSIYNEELTFIYDGDEYNMKSRIPDRVWKIGRGDKTKQMNDPDTNWMLRVALRFAVMDFMLGIDDLVDIDAMPPF